MRPPALHLGTQTGGACTHIHMHTHTQIHKVGELTLELFSLTRTIQRVKIVLGRSLASRKSKTKTSFFFFFSGEKHPVLGCLDSYRLSLIKYELTIKNLPNIQRKKIIAINRSQITNNTFWLPMVLQYWNYQHRL